MHNQLTKQEKELAEIRRKEMEEREKNPLSAYSTTELKKELQRRKKEFQ